MNWTALIAAYHAAAPYIVPVILATPSGVPPIIKAARAAWSSGAAGVGAARRSLSALAAGISAWQRQPVAAAVESHFGLSADDIAGLSKLAAAAPGLLALLDTPAPIPVLTAAETAAQPAPGV